MVAESLPRAVLERYMSEDEAFNLDDFKRTVEEYKRVGLPESVSKLENYLDHAEAGDLKSMYQ